MPPKPTRTPTTSRHVVRSRSSNPAMIAIHSGTVATSRAAMPDGTVCSAQTTMPFPPSRRAPPTMAAESQ